MSEELKRMDWLNEACLAKMENPDPTWHWCSWESVTGGQIVKGSPTTKKKDGSRKWAPKADRVTLVITDADIQAVKIKYVAETGNCSTCCGTTQEWRGWHRDTGDEWKPCRSCAATGKAGKPAKE